jgi:hypothetical protein
VPRGMMQKSAMHAGGVGRFVRSSEDAMVVVLGSSMCGGGVVGGNFQNESGSSQ